MNTKQTIHECIESYSAIASHHIAIVDNDNTYTYNELNNLANQLANYLRRYNDQPEAIIGICLDRSASLLIGLLSILKIGCAYLPLDAKQPKSRLKYQINDANISILITDNKNKIVFDDFNGHLVLINQQTDIFTCEQTTNLNVLVDPRQLAYVIYTSGSTGQPKGVLIEHHSVVNYINWFNQYSDCRPQMAIDFSANIIFDMSITSSLAALALGLKVFICPETSKENVDDYLYFLQKNKINLCKMTPSYFKALNYAAQNNALQLPHLLVIILGGEKLHAKACEMWLAMYPNHLLINEYGPTETTVAVTHFKITADKMSDMGEIIPIGRPALNTRCAIVEGDQIIQTPNQSGELIVQGIPLARGYLNQPELTAQKFVDVPLPGRWYKTGDQCRYLIDGNIEYIKRNDEQI